MNAFTASASATSTSATRTSAAATRTSVASRASMTARSLTFAAIVGLSLGVASPMAMAQTTTTAPLSEPGPSPLVNKTATGTLTIHKKADPTSLGTPTGNVDSTVAGSALPGVGFTVYKINNIDMTTNDGLAAAAGATASNYMLPNGTADLSKVTAVGPEQKTDSNGDIVLPNLSLGAYLVVETSPLAGYSPSAPFIAYLPMTQNNATTGGTEWFYNVHAYPKNYSQKTPEKKVVDSGMNVGDKVTYTVTGYAQTIGENQSRTIFRIEDTLDSKVTPPAASDVTVAGFTAGTDYNVTIDGQKVIITFTQAGVAKITNGQAIIATIPATVNQVGNGNVVNTANVIENNPNTGQEAAPQPSNTVNTYYGGVTFTKVDASNTATALPGAEFQVYGATADQTCSVAVAQQAQMIKLTDPATSTTTDTWTSGTDGKVTINGLHVNDYANSTEGTANQYAKYCLVETKSPSGYELLAEPVEFTVLKANAGQVTPINQAGVIKNLKDTTPSLPMTGGAGVGILAALGAAVVGAGAWFVRRSSKN